MTEYLTEEVSWNTCTYQNLPDWLQDNEFLHKGYRPTLPSFRACFKSIFSLHTETVNIWTHLLGCIVFIGVALVFLTRPSFEIQIQEKLIFSTFFFSTIACLSLSFAFHTFSCHSKVVSDLLCKLDYCGIALEIMGSIVPVVYYGFYCHHQLRDIYLTVVVLFGFVTILTSLSDTFSETNLRPVRVGKIV